jgi:hypothetical protein
LFANNSLATTYVFGRVTDRLNPTWAGLSSALPLRTVSIGEKKHQARISRCSRNLCIDSALDSNLQNGTVLASLQVSALAPTAFLAQEGSMKKLLIAAPIALLAVLALNVAPGYS